jgi:hypothetical protein
MEKNHMKKIALSLILCSFMLHAETKEGLWVDGKQITTKLPLAPECLSFENGGKLNAIEAYQDGVGLIINGAEAVNNTAMNTLVFKFGQEAKDNGVGLVDEVINVSGISTPTDIKLAKTLNAVTPSSGEAEMNCETGYSGDPFDANSDPIQQGIEEFRVQEIFQHYHRNGFN